MIVYQKKSIGADKAPITVPPAVVANSHHNHKKTRLVKLAGERERFELSYLEHGIKA
jgi:hypothetical protein